MNSSSGVNPDPSPNVIPGVSQSDLQGIPQGNVEAALKTPVSTLGQLKALLISNLGQEAGTKLYNTFLTSFGMIMLQQMQDSAQRAQQAAANARNLPPT